MEQKLINTYKFKELSDTVKKKIREGYEADENWYEDTIDTWIEKIAKRGFYNLDINFSGFWSQGDGASFVSNLDLAEYIKSIQEIEKDFNYEVILKAIEDDEIDITENIVKRTNNHYYHERSTKLYLSYSPLVEELPDNFDRLFNDLEAKIAVHIVAINKKIYTNLEIVYNNIIKAENVDSYFIELDNDYFIDGEICNYRDESSNDFQKV